MIIHGFILNGSPMSLLSVPGAKEYVIELIAQQIAKYGWLGHAVGTKN
jgi:hypothetical protein